MSAEPDTRALAKRFFDAVEAGDIVTLHGCYAPEARIWHNTDRVYANRRLQVFEGGFVQQHELRGVRPDGVAVSLTACIVCAVEGGLITRLDEYFDSAQVATFVGAA